jgi:hypothetical protein
MFDNVTYLGDIGLGNISLLVIVIILVISKVGSNSIKSLLDSITVLGDRCSSLFISFFSA